MKKRTEIIMGGTVITMMLVIGAMICLGPGCMTSKTSTVTATTNTTTGAVTDVTNVVVTVNAANLALDCAGIQTATGLAVSLTLQKDPGAKPALQNIQTALSGIISGANSNSVTQIATIIGSSTNATVVSNLTPLVGSISSLEQSMITKYGATVGGQIGLAIATAVNNGITQGL